MGFKLEGCTIGELITEIRKIEIPTKPFRQDIAQQGNARNKWAPWKQLDHNVQTQGKPIFSLQMKPEETPENKEGKIVKVIKDITNTIKMLFGKGDPRRRIPGGNYYIEFYYYRKNGSKKETVGYVDLKWNKNGLITKPGIHPVFFPHKNYVLNRKSGINTKTREMRDPTEVSMKTIERMLADCIIDRLKQICFKKGALPKFHLLAETINYVFKYSETFIGNKDNYIMKLKNRVIYLPLKVVTATSKRDSWGFHPDSNPNGNLSDVLNSNTGIDIDKFEEMLEYYDSVDCPIIMAEASEEGGRKGNITIVNTELQKLRRPYDIPYEQNYRDVMYGQVPAKFLKNGEKNTVYTIYPERAKLYARLKSFISSDGSIGHYDSAPVLDEYNEIIFDRHKTYLDNKKEKQGLNTPKTINMIVVFDSIDDTAANITTEEFRKCDKNKYSELLHMADCHIPISQNAAKTLISIRRKISQPITQKHLSLDFKEKMKLLAAEGPQKVSAKLPIGYKVICEDCASLMSPVYTGIDEGSEQEILCDITDEMNAKETKEWHCDVCNMYYDNVLLDRKDAPEDSIFMEEIALSSKFPSAKEVIICGIEMDDVESSISIDIDIIAPINSSRLISADGLKAFSVVMAQDFIGTLSGKIYNPLTGKMIEIKNLPADMVCPMGAMKAKLSGISLSQVRFINALTGANICPDEVYREEGNLNKINEMLSNCELLTHRRREFNVKTRKYEWVEKQRMAGMINITVTDRGEEFDAVKDEHQDMKVSYMNTMTYDWLGKEKLNESMMRSSLVDLNKQDNQNFALELFRLFYADPDGLTRVTQDDFNNGDNSISIVSWLEKQTWDVLINGAHSKEVDGERELPHPLFRKGGKFENGAYYQLEKQDRDGNIVLDKNGNPEIMQTVVFPSRKTIMQLVDVMNGDRIRLNGIVTDALGMFLDIYMYGSTQKLNYYKENIYKKLTGKQGILARSTAFVNYGVSGKEMGQSGIPTGTSIIGNKRWWKEAIKQGKEHGIDPQCYFTGEVPLYASAQRDPYVWLTQGCNAVELWPIKRADEHFLAERGIKFSEIYPNFTGVMTNTLDMLYLFQADADGDLKRLLTPFDLNAQFELSEFNKEMKNYDFLCKADPDSEIGKMFALIEDWHLNYVKEEVVSSAKNYGDKYYINVKRFSVKAKNSLIIKGWRAKGSIGEITVSQWKIQDVCDQLVRSETKLILDKAREPMPLTKDLRNAICLFYQTVFTQDGCVKSLKGTKDLSKCAFDEIANNGQTAWQDIDKGICYGGYLDDKGKLVMYSADDKAAKRVRDMVRDEADGTPFEFVIDAFFAVCDHWKFTAGIIADKNTGQATTDKSIVAPDAEMINAYISLCNGSKFSSMDKLTMFQRLVGTGHEVLFQSRLIKPLIPYLLKIKERDAKAKKLEKEKKNENSANN